MDGKDVITPPKTPKSNRKITIPPFLAEELKEYCGRLYGIMPNERMFRFTKSYMEHEVLGGIAPKANKLEQAKQMLRELAETSNQL